MISGDREPAVSPDGRWIAFARGEADSSEAIRPPAGSQTIYIRPALPQPLSAAPAVPAVRPGRPMGRKSCLHRSESRHGRGSGLWKLRLEGGEPVQILAAGAAAAIPVVSRNRTTSPSLAALSSRAAFGGRRSPLKGQPALPPVRLTEKLPLADGERRVFPGRPAASYSLGPLRNARDLDVR